MKKFAFSLQALADVKDSLEFQQKMLLRSCEEKLALLQAQLADLLAELARTRQEHQADIMRGVSATRLVHYTNYYELLLAARAAKEKEISQAEKERQACVCALVKIRQEQKSLEKLYEIEWEEYQLLLKQEEYKLVDDLVSYKVAAGPNDD